MNSIIKSYIEGITLLLTLLSPFIFLLYRYLGLYAVILLLYILCVYGNITYPGYPQTAILWHLNTTLGYLIVAPIINLYQNTKTFFISDNNHEK